MRYSGVLLLDGVLVGKSTRSPSAGGGGGSSSVSSVLDNSSLTVGSGADDLEYFRRVFFNREYTMTSSGLSTAAMTLAASLIFCQVCSRLIMWTPSAFLWSTYLFIS